jgi:hypothetical protein
MFIKLTKGQHALVDQEDFDYLNQWKWRFSGKYAVRSGPRSNYKRKFISMHRLLMGEPLGLEVDHVNGDKLDNRRSNLRLCSRQQNARNQKKTSINKSGYRGVFWHSKAKKWCVQISVNKKNKHVGLFENLKDAARAYDSAARVFHGVFAKTNF